MSTGVLMGLGVRDGSALEPFQQFGRMTTASVTGLVPSLALAAAVGLGGHLLWMLVLGVGFALVARTPHVGRLAVLALLYSAIAGWLTMRVLPSLLGAAGVASLSTSQFLFFLALFALALVVGTRIATH